MEEEVRNICTVYDGPRTKLLGASDHPKWDSRIGVHLGGVDTLLTAIYTKFRSLQRIAFADTVGLHIMALKVLHTISQFAVLRHVFAFSSLRDSPCCEALSR